MVKPKKKKMKPKQLIIAIQKTYGKTLNVPWSPKNILSTISDIPRNIWAMNATATPVMYLILF